MKKVLCFGDSNVYGFNPKDGSRYDIKTRWTGVLSELAKGKYEIIEAGLNNRTCYSNSPEGVEFTGCKILPECLKSNPDIIIFGIGINDLQKRYAPDALKISKGLSLIIKTAKTALSDLKIILMTPSTLKPFILNTFFASMFNEKSIQLSYLLPEIYKAVSQREEIFLLDLNKIAETSNMDGLHYTKEAHLKIAHAVYDFLIYNNL